MFSRNGQPDPSRPSSCTRRCALSCLLAATALVVAAFVAFQSRSIPAGGDRRNAPREEAALVDAFREAVSVLEWYDYAGAYERFSSLAKARPHWSAAHFNAGLAALNLREDKERGIEYLPIAETEFREPLRLDPKCLHALFSLGVLLRHQQRADEALELFEAVVRADPSDPYALCEYGALLADLGRRAEARKCLEASLGIQPALSTALYKLGHVVYRNLNEPARAGKALEDFRALSRPTKSGVIPGFK